jgi:hypothetical protein
MTRINRDVTLEYLAELPHVEPTAGRAARIRARAHVELQKRHHSRSKASLGRIAVNAAVVLISSVYLAGAVGQAIRLFAGLGRAMR